MRMPKSSKPEDAAGSVRPARAVRRPLAAHPRDWRLPALGLAIILLASGWFWIINTPPPVAPPAPAPKVAAPVPLPDIEILVPPPKPVEVAVEPPAPVVVPPAPAPAVIEPVPVAPVEDPRLAVFKEPLHLLVPLANRPSNKENFAKAIGVAVETGRWDLFRAYLRGGFDDAMKKVSLRTGADRFNALLAEPMFVRAMHLQGFIDTVDSHFLAGLAGKTAVHPFYRWLLLENQDVLPEFLQAMDGNVSTSRVLETWAALWNSEAEPKLRDTYHALMLACAMVYPGDEYASADSRAANRYRIFRDNAEKGRLTGKIHRMKAEDLIWVVDVPVADAEIEWALDKVHLPQKRWGEAYGMVEYLMERAVEGENPYKEYTFEEILEHGGVCADQSYFAANTAKCHGIPAVIFGGDGDRGGHAWILFMPDEDTWAESGNIGYTTGMTRHPVSGEMIHQSVMDMATDRRTRGERLEKTKTYLAFMSCSSRSGGATSPRRRSIPPSATRRNTRCHGKPPSISARTPSPRPRSRSGRIWRIPYGGASRTGRTFLNWRRASRTTTYSRCGRRRKIRWTSPASAAGSSATTTGGPTWSRPVSTARPTSWPRPATSMASPRCNRRAFKDHGGKADAFRIIAAQYFARASTKDDWKEKACRTIELAYKRHIESNTDEYFRATAEIGILRQISGYYGQSGDAKRAELLGDRAKKREKSVKRSAL